MNRLIIDILVRRIENGETNPITSEPMQLEDIKIESYKVEVENILNSHLIEKPLPIPLDEI